MGKKYKWGKEREAGKTHGRKEAEKKQWEDMKEKMFNNLKLQEQR